MKNITKLWEKVKSTLAESCEKKEYNEGIYDKFGEIFKIKDVEEFGMMCDEDVLPLAHYRHTTRAIRRALVEGYLLAQTERRQEDIKLLKKCHALEVKE
jgi:hypothetical protein